MGFQNLSTQAPHLSSQHGNVKIMQVLKPEPSHGLRLRHGFPSNPMDFVALILFAPPELCNNFTQIITENFC
jgi:hypothetical protein